MKIIIGTWQRDQAFPVEYLNIIVRREHDVEKPTDEYLCVIPVQCTRWQHLAVKLAYLRKLSTLYPNFPQFFSAIEDHDTQPGDLDLLTQRGLVEMWVSDK